MHAWRYWFDRSNELERTVYEIAEAYYGKYGYSNVTDLRMVDDPQYKLAISQQQFAERRVATFGMAVVIRMLEMWVERGRSE
jgi:hypothetical protein